MAVFHLHTHAISRSAHGGSAIACAAYRSGQVLRERSTGEGSSSREVKRAGRTAEEAAAYRSGGVVEDRSGKRHDYSRKGGVEHAQIVLPAGVSAEWALDRETLWNAVEQAEKRINSRVAREWRLALPAELDRDERLSLVREFAELIAGRYGVAADMAIHSPSRSGDQRNWHAHILCTTRQISEVGFGAKAVIEWSNTNLAAADLPYTSLQIREMRMAWEELANTHLALAGFAERIDHRSYAEQGLGLEPRRTVHAGRHHAEMRDGVEGTSRIIPVERLGAEQSARNAELISREPEQLLTLIARQSSVFSREDVARALHRYVSDDWLTFNAALERVMADAAVVCLDEGGRSDTGRIVAPVYTTVETFRREARMLASAGRLHADRRRLISDKALTVAFRQLPFLAQEQRDAVRHTADGARLSVVRGVAGTGKTTMLAAFKLAADRSGVRVVGAALAGKAAGELQAGSGIESRTLASLERSWAAGFNALGRGDILVIDEAGMVGSQQLGRVLEAVERQGASVVLVGDQRQIGAIESGRAFGNILDRTGAVELTEVRRQREEWQRAATKTFGAGATGAALDAYHERGDVRLHADSATARAALVTDYFARLDEARRAGVGQDHLIATYRRADVDLLNAAVRAERHCRGELGEDVLFHTEEGFKTFATGDRVMLRQNERELGVANGDRAEVLEAIEDRLLLQLDQGRVVEIRSDRYAALDHAYAITMHKAQGMTVDRVHVFGSQGMDSALTYVAMTRQRDGAILHAGRDEFRDYEALKTALSRESRARGIGDYVWDAPAFARIEAAIAARQARQEKASAEARIEAPEITPTTGQAEEASDRTAAIKQAFTTRDETPALDAAKLRETFAARTVAPGVEDLKAAFAVGKGGQQASVEPEDRREAFLKDTAKAEGIDQENGKDQASLLSLSPDRSAERDD